MSRIARIINQNGYYHVISRSINETRIFKEPSDFHHFLQLHREAKTKHPIRLFHYVVMRTHFHFIVQTPDHLTISKHIAFLKWNYTKWVKKKYGWKGPLWRERFKSIPIENEIYLANCGRYIEFNPVRDGLCASPEEYPYSSYRKYYLGIKDAFVDEGG